MSSTPDFTVPNFDNFDPRENAEPGGVKPVTPQPEQLRPALGYVRKGEAALSILQAYNASRDKALAAAGLTTQSLSDDMAQQAGQLDTDMEAIRAQFPPVSTQNEAA